MKFLILGIFTSFFSFYILPQKKSNYNLESYLTQDKSLDKKVEEIFESLNLNSLIGQLIMPACGRLGQKIDTIKALLN